MWVVLSPSVVCLSFFGLEKMDTNKGISSIVSAAVESFATGFEARHIAEVDNPEGVIQSKINNVFIRELGEELVYYSALVRSFDSSFGNMLERMAINIAKPFYEVYNNVDGPIYQEQLNHINNILEKYKRNEVKPDSNHYNAIHKFTGKIDYKRHDSDYYLYDRENNSHYLIELKIGGDLDTKKARSEKEALLEQYAILANSIGDDADIYIRFATAYNKYGEGKPWHQHQVLRYFSEDELLIAKEFWNFITKNSNGYDIVLQAYRENVHKIKAALQRIKECYLS